MRMLFWALERPAGLVHKPEGASVHPPPLQGCPTCSLEPLKIHLRTLRIGVPTVVPGSPSLLGTALLGTRGCTLKGPWPSPPTSAQATPSQLDHAVPPSMSVCLCLFSMQNVVPIGEGDSVDVPQDSESQLQEQEKRIEISCALATEASRRGRMLSGERGWASLRQGHQLTRCRGGSAVLARGQAQERRQAKEMVLRVGPSTGFVLDSGRGQSGQPPGAQLS